MQFVTLDVTPILIPTFMSPISLWSLPFGRRSPEPVEVSVSTGGHDLSLDALHIDVRQVFSISPTIIAKITYKPRRYKFKNNIPVNRQPRRDSSKPVPARELPRVKLSVRPSVFIDDTKPCLISESDMAPQVK
jgi:hypothetical protein